MSFSRIGSSLAAAWFFLIAPATVMATPTMSIGSTTNVPGATNLVPVSVTIDTNVVSLQFDIWYNTNYFTPGTPIGGNALSDQQLYSAVVSNQIFRVLAISFDDMPLTNGVVAYVPFVIASNTPDHDDSLLLSNVVLVDAAASNVPVNVNSNAVLTVTVAPEFTAIYPTNGGIHLDLTGTPGRVYSVQAATNLSLPQWTTLAINTNLTGVLSFDDSPALDSNRFYRAQFIK
jgi:Cohesin domain